MRSRSDAEKSAHIASAITALKWRQVATDMHCTKLLEKCILALSAADFVTVLRFIGPVTLELGPDPYGGRVLERCVTVWARHLQHTDNDAGRQLHDELVASGLLAFKPMWHATVAVDWAADSCATHVLRKVLLVLWGYVPAMPSPAQIEKKVPLRPTHPRIRLSHSPPIFHFAPGLSQFFNFHLRW